MSRRTHSAFTLVELLVVITVIAILMGIIIPAAAAIRDRANMTKCAKNLEEIAQACINYNSTKQRFPPERQDVLQTGTGTGIRVTVSWAALILSQMGKNDLAPSVTNNTTGTFIAYVDAYVCPSNPPEVASLPSLGYSVNAGQKNNQSNTSLPSDWKENGVFMEAMSTRPTQYVAQDFVFSHDGVGNTLLAADSIGRGPVPKMWHPAEVANELLTGVVWQPTSPQMRPINDPTNLVDDNNISSKHSGGANVVMVSGQSKFLSDKVDPNVLALIMTPDGKHAKLAGSTTPIVQQQLDPTALDQ